MKSDPNLPIILELFAKIGRELFVVRRWLPMPAAKKKVAKKPAAKKPAKKAAPKKKTAKKPAKKK